MPNELNRALKMALVLHFNCQKMCTMWIINQVVSLRCWVTTDHVENMAHTSMVVVCVFFLALCPHVSMEQLPDASTPSNLTMLEHICNLLIIIMRHICQSLSYVHQWESKVQYGFMQYFPRMSVYFWRSTHVHSLTVCEWQALVGSNRVFDVRITYISFDSFWQLISNGLVPFRNFTALVHALFILCVGLWNNCRVIHNVESVSSLLQCATVRCMFNSFSSLSCLWGNTGIYAFYGRCCVTNPVQHTHMLCCRCTRLKFKGLCS